MTDLKKIIRHSKIIILLAIFIVCILGPVFNQSNHLAKKYNHFYSQISGFEQNDINNILKEMEINNEKLYKDTDFDTYKDNHFILNQLKEEYNLAYYYNSWINSQLKNQQKIEKVSIFQKKKNFNSQVSQKIYECYRNLDVQIKPNMQPSLPIELIFENRIIDILLIISVIYFISQLYIKEETEGILNFLRIQPRGKKHLFFSKMKSIFILNLILYIFIYLITIIVIFSLYKAPHFNEPCQSILFFKESTLNLNVWQAMFLAFILKYIILNIFTVFIYFLAILFKNVIFVSLSFSVIQICLIFISQIVYNTTHPIYYLSFFKIFHPENFIRKPIFINIFDQAISFPYFLIILIFFTILLYLIAQKLFINQYKSKKHINKKHIKTKLKSLQQFEMFKLLTLCRIKYLFIFICCIFIAYFYTIQNLTYYDDYLYNYYVDNISSKVNQKTFSLIEKEKNRLEKLEKTLESESNYSKIIEISTELELKNGLQQYESNAYSLAKKNPELSIIKHDQVRFLIENPFLQSLIFSLIFLFISITTYSVTYNDQTNNMILLQKCSGSYRHIHQVQKKCIFYLSIMLILIINTLTIFKNIYMYGVHPLLFMTHETLILSSHIINIPIIIYLFLCVFIQIIVGYFIIQLLYQIFINAKNKNICILISMLITGLLFIILSKNYFNIYEILFLQKYELITIFCVVLIYIIFNKQQRKD